MTQEETYWSPDRGMFWYYLERREHEETALSNVSLEVKSYEVNESLSIRATMPPPGPNRSPKNLYL